MKLVMFCSWSTVFSIFCFSSFHYSAYSFHSNFKDSSPTEGLDGWQWSRGVLNELQLKFFQDRRVHSQVKLRCSSQRSAIFPGEQSAHPPHRNIPFPLWSSNVRNFFIIFTGFNCYDAMNWRSKMPPPLSVNWPAIRKGTTARCIQRERADREKFACRSPESDVGLWERIFFQNWFNGV